MNKRRSFLKKVGLGSALAIAGNYPLDAFGEEKHELVILHTNDVHSHLEPFPDDHSKFPGMGGIAARHVIIKKIRAKHKNVILLDAGDIFQGTPYFNFFGGEPEIKAMSKMGYDAATLGNHDFDGGLENLDQQIMHANFPFVCSNYNFNNNVLNKKTIPFHIIKKGKIKIGIIGLGVELKGLVPNHLYGNTTYSDPIIAAQTTANLLKEEYHCHLVIALSHLGYSYTNDRVSDVVLAEKTKNIDIIIGGHTHTFMDAPDVRKNVDNHEVYIHQAGWAGLRLGQINVIFEKNLKKKSLSTHTVIVDKKSSAF